jgi:hypothetical protein
MATPAPADRDPPGRRPAASSLKSMATWGVVVGTAVWTAFFFAFLVASALFPDVVPDSWFLRMVREHPGGTLGLAISAISAFSVVAILDVLSHDPIEIRLPGFELKGAAGPVVLWVVCFLAIVAGGETLWDNQGVMGSSATATTVSAP